MPPQSVTGKALHYLHNEWTKLIRYQNDGRLENGLQPFVYLRRVFAELPKANTVEAIEALLPGNIRLDQVSSAVSNTVVC